MQGLGKFKIIDENGKEKEYALIATFEHNKKSFVLYTDYSLDENKSTKVYSSIYDPNDTTGELKKVTEAEDIEFINKFIKELERGLKAE